MNNPRKRNNFESNDHYERSKRFKPNSESNPFSFKPNKLKLLADLGKIIDFKNDVELLLSLNVGNGAFMMAFKYHGDDDDLTMLILKALGKISTTHWEGNSREILINFISQILPNNVSAVDQHRFFNKRLPLFIASINSNEKEGVPMHYKDAVQNLINFLVKLQEICPRASIDVTKLIGSNLLAKIQFINRDQEIFSNECIETLEQILSTAKEQVQPENPDSKNKSEGQILKEYHFRSIPICPDAIDILTDKRPHLPENNINEKYKNGVDQYLDTQFRLLREDLIRPLREGVVEYIGLVQSNKAAGVIKLKDVNVYKGVRLISSNITRAGDLFHSAKFDLKNLNKIQWKCSKRFLSGSLICLSSDNFKTIKFATLAGRRDPDRLQNGEFQMKFENDDENVRAAVDISTFPLMTMIELKVFYEAYRHNLRVLQRFDADTFPLKKYIVDVETKIDPPAYLQTDTCYNLKPLGLAEKINDITANTYENVRILEKSCWPDKTYFGLDESQYEALIAALTRQMAIIQGPPGTGKTYLGHRIIEALLLNKGKGKRTEAPILIVCYTNHALDQFLEGISSFCQKMVRIGGNSNSEILENHNLNTIKEKMTEARQVPNYIFRNKKSYEFSMRQIRTQVSEHSDLLAAAKTKILFEEISDCISKVNNAHLKTFKREDKRGDGDFIVEWLGYEQVYRKMNGEVMRPSERNHKKKIEEVEEDESVINYIQGMREINENKENVISDAKNKAKLKVYYKPIDTTGPVRQSPNELNSTKPKMNLNEARHISNILRLNHRDRWRLYHLWVHQLVVKKQEQLEKALKEYAEVVKKYKAVTIEEELHICKGVDVIGMTTTGAAKYRHIVEELKPQIVVVEEAAEVLEAHIVTTLCVKTDHLILIGDHLQLKPTPAVYALAKRFNLETSMFERLIINGLEYFQLKIQHRMRPEISSLLVPHIYKELFDHESVKQYDKVKGISHNVFFLDHHENDNNLNDINSRYNIYEAAFAVELCRYLILQGYEQNRITILTMYSGQLHQIRRAMSGYELLKSVRIAVVDNFQGEENDIIIISLVRGNDEGDIGFLSTPNRVNVALSRAKNALYCIGNFECLMKKSSLWQQIVAKAKEKNAFGPALTLFCQNHSDFKITASKPADFKAMPEGSCSKKCDARLDCGHACPLTCHITDMDHKKHRCLRTCNEELCKQKHKCPKQCFMCHLDENGCGPCTAIVEKQRSCGHVIRAKCSANPKDSKCLTLCDKELPCGHKTKMFCYDLEIKKKIVCKQPCNALLECGHKCAGSCSRCYRGRLHMSCQKKCSRMLLCGHKCRENCSVSCPPCEERCSIRCKHSSCSLVCRKTCLPCRMECDWKCIHLKCSRPCNKLCDRDICEKSCEKLLKCKHPCIGICGECGEFCPKLCRICDKNRVQEVFLGHEDEPDARFLRLPDCGHVIEIKGLLKWVKNQSAQAHDSEDVSDESEDACIQAITCPLCKTPIGRSNALKRFTQNAQADVKKIVDKANGKASENQKIELHQKISSIILKNSPGSFNNKLMNDIKNKLLGQLGETDMTKIEINEVANTFNIWKQLVDFSSVYETCEIIQKLYPNNVSVEKLEEIKMRLTDSIKFLSGFKNTKQEMADITQECEIFEMLVKALKIASRGHFNDHLHALSTEVLNKTLCFDRKAERGQTVEEIKKLINEASIEQSGMPLTFEEKVMILKAMSLTSGHWYKCRNGHHYCITECGGAVTRGKCPECASTIGGSGHFLVAGNTRASEMEINYERL